MTRQERDQLIEVMRRIEMGDDSLATHILHRMIDIVERDMRLEDEVNTALELSAKGTADDQKQRPV